MWLLPAMLVVVVLVVLMVLVLGAVLHNDQCGLWLQPENVLHCAGSAADAAFLQPLSKGEQHNQGTCLKPVAKADSTN